MIIKGAMRVVWELAGWYYKCRAYSKRQSQKVREMHEAAKAR